MRTLGLVADGLRSLGQHQRPRRGISCKLPVHMGHSLGGSRRPALNENVPQLGNSCGTAYRNEATSRPWVWPTPVIPSWPEIGAFRCERRPGLVKVTNYLKPYFCGIAGRSVYGLPAADHPPVQHGHRDEPSGIGRYAGDSWWAACRAKASSNASGSSRCRKDRPSQVGQRVAQATSKPPGLLNAEVTACRPVAPPHPAHA